MYNACTPTSTCALHTRCTHTHTHTAWTHKLHESCAIPTLTLTTTLWMGITVPCEMCSKDDRGQHDNTCSSYCHLCNFYITHTIHAHTNTRTHTVPLFSHTHARAHTHTQHANTSIHNEHQSRLTKLSPWACADCVTTACQIPASAVSDPSDPAEELGSPSKNLELEASTTEFSDVL